MDENAPKYKLSSQYRLLYIGCKYSEDAFK